MRIICSKGNISSANGARRENIVSNRITQATSLVFSTPILIARVFLPLSPSISSISLMISRAKLYVKPMINSEITLELVKSNTPAPPNKITIPTERLIAILPGSPLSFNFKLKLLDDS